MPRRSLRVMPRRSLRAMPRRRLRLIPRRRSRSGRCRCRRILFLQPFSSREGGCNLSRAFLAKQPQAFLVSGKYSMDMGGRRSVEDEDPYEPEPPEVGDEAGVEQAAPPVGPAQPRSRSRSAARTRDPVARDACVLNAAEIQDLRRAVMQQHRTQQALFEEHWRLRAMQRRLQRELNILKHRLNGEGSE